MAVRGDSSRLILQKVVKFNNLEPLALPYSGVPGKIGGFQDYGASPVWLPFGSHEAAPSAVLFTRLLSPIAEAREMAGASNGWAILTPSPRVGKSA